MFFHPENPKFRRGIVILSTITCTFVGMHVVMGDFGTQKHVFTPVQAYIIPKVDEFFGIDSAELARAMVERRSKREAEIKDKAASAALMHAAEKSSSVGSSPNGFRNMNSGAVAGQKKA